MIQIKLIIYENNFLDKIQKKINYILKTIKEHSNFFCDFAKIKR